MFLGRCLEKVGHETFTLVARIYQFLCLYRKSVVLMHKNMKYIEGLVSRLCARGLPLAVMASVMARNSDCEVPPEIPIVLSGAVDSRFLVPGAQIWN